jgi:hypothetical protein
MAAHELTQDIILVFMRKPNKTVRCPYGMVEAFAYEVQLPRVISGLNGTVHAGHLGVNVGTMKFWTVSRHLPQYWYRKLRRSLEFTG